MVNDYCPCSKNFIKKLFSKKYHLPYIHFMQNLNVFPKFHREATKNWTWDSISLKWEQIFVCVAMAPHSSTLAWKIPWTEEPGRLQSTRLLRVGHDWTTVLTVQYRFLRRQVRWSGIPIFKNFPQFVVIHTVKGFGIVNKAEIDVFLEFSCFFYDPMDVRNLISDLWLF